MRSLRRSRPKGKIMKNSQIDQKIVLECKQKLVLLREELMNRMRGARLEVTAHEKMAGDEADQTAAQSLENEFASRQNRLRAQMLEVEHALARIQRGDFGLCEETNEPIEEARLLALPYTRLSIEGAELREAMQKRFVTKG
jgi:DnaK suppressor protein